jgi:DNA-directed RNA polymerase specialized sigma24 family protein
MELMERKRKIVRRKRPAGAAARAESLIVRQAREGNVAALNQLYRRHSKKILALSASLTENAQEAKDLSREVLQKSFALIPAMPRGATFFSWISRLTKTTASELRRKSQNNSAHSENHVALSPLPESSSALDPLLARFHTLVDNKLAGTFSSADSRELAELEERFEALEDTQTSAIDDLLERRHLATLQKLAELTAELRNLTSTASSPAKVQ